MDKAAKRIMAKQHKANIKINTPEAGSDIVEPGLAEEIIITPATKYIKA